MKKRDYNYLVLIIITLGLVFVLKGTNMFGSMTDWLCQHSVFPDYFRKLFYETGNIFPNLALNIGAGQNIFNFSYYGLLNPVYMLSYFLPFVDMTTYIMLVSIFTVIASVCLIYYFLKGKYSTILSFGGAILYLTASPILFHAHRHIMFVNYMPFLIMALIGVDHYFDKKKSMMLIFSLFLMFMTSYYYSIGGCLVVALYAIYKYLSITPKVTFKDFIVTALKFMVPCTIGVLLSSLLLFPTLYVILTSRTGIGESVNLSTLLLPSVNMKSLLYYHYAMGLTSISLVALIGSLLIHKKEDKYLSVALLVILLIPLFTYLLNGGLYIRSKVLIPLIPLFIFLIVNFISKIKSIRIKLFIPLIIVVNMIILTGGYNEIFYYIDLLVTLICLLLFVRYKHEYILLPLLIIGLCNVMVANQNESYVSYQKYKSIFDDKDDIISVLDSDKGFYRFNNVNDVSYTMNKIYDSRYYQTSLYSSTYNNYYKEFLESHMRLALPLRNTLDQVQVDNVLFQTFMGVKYVKTDNPSLGFTKVKDDIYLNPYAYPVFFATDKVTSEKVYDELSYPYNLEYLMNSIVVDKDSDLRLDSNITPYQLSYKREGDIDYTKTDYGYLVDTDSKTDIKLLLNEKIDDILIIKFDILEPSECSLGDLSISINGVTNKLTCSSWMYYNGNESFEYVISSNEPISELDIAFSKGQFKIGNIEVYRMASITNLNYDEFIADKYIGDTISGSIDVTNDGYFMMMLPYDNGYKIYVDDVKIDYELVNKAFIGFPIEKGHHEIKVIYEAPFFKVGKWVSLISLLMAMMIIYYEKKNI